ncbi:MAG: glycosyltransferase family 39 protein [Wolinella sp.]
MRSLDRADGGFFIILLLSVLSLLWMNRYLSVSIYEARIYLQEGLVSWFSHLFVPIFGSNNLGIKLPFILLHLFNLALFYEVSRHTLKRPVDSLFSVGIFALLPGVNASALFISNSALVMSITLLVCYWHLKFRTIPYWVLVGAIFIDSNAMAILFLALFFYAMKRRDNTLLLFALFAFAMNMYLTGIEVGGRPRGHFLDTLGIFALLFSPFLFLYFVYSLYRILVKEEKTLLWYIAFVALFFTLLLSIRQKIEIQEHAPLVLIGLPLVVKVFFEGLRVRLPRFRKSYRVWFVIAVSALFIHWLILMTHPLFYRFLKNPREHFAYGFHIANELAEALKARGITKIKLKDETMMERLAVYGIERGGKVELKKAGGAHARGAISIGYFGHEIERYYIYEK